MLSYVVKQGVHQLDLVRKSQPIAKVLNDPTLSMQDKQALQWIMQIREYAKDRLGMNVGKNYTTVNLRFKKQIYSVSASSPLAFDKFLWNFPIVGAMPFLGFFDKEDAEKEEAKLKAKGLDTQLGRIGAYSTLGYFNDPVLPQMLRWPKAELADLIFHELTHNTVFFPGKSEFNESFATFVAKKATLQFLAELEGKKSVLYQECQKTYADEDLYKKTMWTLYRRLDDLYKSTFSDSEKRKRKARYIKEGISQLENLPFQSKAYQGLQIKHLNNASLLSFGRYNSSDVEFEQAFQSVKGDFRRFFALEQDRF